MSVEGDEAVCRKGNGGQSCLVVSCGRHPESVEKGKKMYRALNGSFEDVGTETPRVFCGRKRGSVRELVCPLFTEDRTLSDQMLLRVCVIALLSLDGAYEVSAEILVVTGSASVFSSS